MVVLNRFVKRLTGLLLLLAPIAASFAAGTVAGADPSDIESGNSSGYLGIFGLIAGVALLLSLSLFAQYTLPLAACLVLGAVVGGVFGTTAGWIAAAAAAVWFFANKS